MKGTEGKLPKGHSSGNLLEYSYKENKTMTCYEGHWIRKSRVKFLNSMYHKYHRKLKADKKLCTSAEKQKKLDKLMGKLYQTEHRLLRIQLAKSNYPPKDSSVSEKLDNNNKDGRQSNKHKVRLSSDEVGDGRTLETQPSKALSKNSNGILNGKQRRTGVPKKSGKYLGINYKEDPDIVKYEGVYIHKKSVDRLDKLKEELTQKGLTGENYTKAFKGECRRAERALKKERSVRASAGSHNDKKDSYLNKNGSRQYIIFHPDADSYDDKNDEKDVVQTPKDSHLNKNGSCQHIIFHPDTDSYDDKNVRSQKVQSTEILQSPKLIPFPSRNCSHSNKPNVQSFDGKPKMHIVFDD